MGALTDLEARNAKPRQKAYKLSGGRGLCLVVMPNGSKYWWLRYRFAGREKSLSLGVYPAVSLRDAEAAVDKARALLRSEIDPSEEKRERKLALRVNAARTFGDAAEKWVAHNTPRWKPATLEKVRQYLDKDLLPPLARRPLSSISPVELGVVIGRIEQRKALNVSKKARQWLNKIFEHSIARGLTTTNPAEHLEAIAAPPPEAKNHAHIALHELPAFLRALDAYEGSLLVKAATWLALWTANRPGVIRTLRWNELDLDSALWTIEKGREGMKKGYRHLTPLPTQAVAVLREVQQLTGTFEHVFINRNSPRKPMSDGAINVMLKKIGYGGRQTAHGFRHLVSTALNERGYKPDWVERQLAHGDPDTIRDTYNKAMYLAERRKMMQAWADYLEATAKGNSHER
jgi:integrase